MIFPITLRATESGTLQNYPLLSLSDTFKPSIAYRLVGGFLGLQVNNPNPLASLAPMGIFVVVGSDARVNRVSQEAKIVGQLAPPRGIFNLAAPLRFGAYFVDVPPGCPISLYSCGGVVDPIYPLYGVATLFLVPAA